MHTVQFDVTHLLEGWDGRKGIPSTDFIVPSLEH
jgi:hypothetical protein